MDIARDIAGVWVPTRIAEWQNCPTPLVARLQTYYRYEISASGKVLDLLCPKHTAQISPTRAAKNWEGWGYWEGVNPSVFVAHFELQKELRLASKRLDQVVGAAAHVVVE